MDWRQCLSEFIGGLLGECIDIKLRLDHLGIRLQHLAKADNNCMFVEGFVTASLVICVGYNLIFGKKIKVGNLLPAILIPVFWKILQTVVGIA